MAGLLDDLGGYTPEQAWRGRYRARRGGILDMLPDDEAMPRDAEPAGMLSSVRSGANQALGLLDHYTMGIPSTAAGLINAAIPFQPLGDMMTSVQAGRDAADEFAANGRGARDLLSLPDAFAGSVPGGANHLAARDVRTIPKQDIDLSSRLREHSAINASAADYLANNGHTGYIYAADIPKPTVHVTDGHPYYNVPQSKALDMLGSEGHKSVRYDSGEIAVTDPSAIKIVGRNSDNIPPPPDGYNRGYHGSQNDFTEFKPPAFFAENNGIANTYRIDGGGDALNGISKNGLPMVGRRAAMAEYNANWDRGKAAAGLREESDKFDTEARMLTSNPASTNASAYIDLFKEGAAQAGRGIDKGSRNYVVFDDKLIDILKKYGITGTMVAGGGMAVSSSDVEAHPALIPLLMGTAGLMAYDYAPQPGMLDLMGPQSMQLAMNNSGDGTRMKSIMDGPQPLWDEKTTRDEYFKRMYNYDARREVMGPNWKHPDEAPPMYLSNPNARGKLPLNPAWIEWDKKHKSR